MLVLPKSVGYLTLVANVAGTEFTVVAVVLVAPVGSITAHVN